MMRARWLVLIVVLGAAALTLLAVVERGPYEVDHPDATVGGPPLPTTGTAIAAVARIGGLEDLSELVGQRVELAVDIGKAVNDVAFWSGSPPDQLLVVINRGGRSARDQSLGRAAGDPLSAPVQGTALVRGVIEPLPYAEAMFSWGLTRRDVAVAQERGVYLRVDEIVPLATPMTSAEAIDEAARETAPPPGEQVETPLNLPPPPP
jgi:hypothetical protein